MKMQSVLFAAAALSASALTVAMAAAPAHAKSVEEVVVTGRASDLPTAIVRYGDLNLGSEKGRDGLQRRISQAANMLCGVPMRQPVKLNGLVNDCRSAVFTSAKPQVEAVFAAFDRGERLALGDTAGITLSAK